ncbi:MAG: hypothetical protein MZV65_21155 [Chromatiales bacterium]|nr:hypothetical protein [Chromatiales bacterium]
MAVIRGRSGKTLSIFGTKYSQESKFAVFFKVEKVLPLVAPGVLKRGVTQQ